MTNKLNKFYNSNFDNITNVLLYKKLHVPDYKSYLYKNHIVYTIKTNYPNKKWSIERYMYHIDNKDKIIMSGIIYDRKTRKLLNKWNNIKNT